jgi:hypothetical protein
MRSKIFNAKLLLLCAFMVAGQGSFAQKNKSDDEKEFNKQMEKLQEQMRDLQKQMNKLQVQKLKEKSVELQKLSKDLSGKTLVYTNDIDVSGISKGLGVIVNPKINSTITSSIQRSAAAAAAAGRAQGHSYSFNFNDDQTIQERVKSGEVKEKTKSYTKSYPVDGRDKLQISNSFGKITINTWAKNEVKVDVQMKAYANEEEDAQKLLDNISITDSKESDVISFKTNIERTSNSSSYTRGTWFSSGKSHTRKSEINYTVYMPAKNQLQISNTYGNVILPEFAGKVAMKITYGTLTAQQLTDPNIKIVYGDAKINGITEGDVSITYGNLFLGTGDKLKAKVTYGGMTIDRLKSYGDLAAVYGDGIKIGELDKNCKTVNVKAVYTNVNLGVKSDYDFDVTTTSGSFNYDKSAVKVLTTTPTDGTRHYIITKNFKGQVNKGDTDKLITVKSTYANVKFD